MSRLGVNIKEYPLGQYVVDIVNLDRPFWMTPAGECGNCPSVAEGKTDSAAALAQERLNAVWDLILTLSVYRGLPMDEESSCRTGIIAVC